jgi:hypothetical protein
MRAFPIAPTPYPYVGKDEVQAAAIMLFIVGMGRARIIRRTMIRV